MTERKLKGIDEKTIVHCQTEEIANKVLRIAHEHGYKWLSGHSFLRYKFWYVYKSETCYNFLIGDYGEKTSYENGFNTFISGEDFIKLNTSTVNLSECELKKEIERMKRKINYAEAQQIVDIACNSWKEILFEKWGKEMFYKKDIEISEEFYKSMRQSCTKEQHELFDSIFGLDNKKFDSSMLKVGEYMRISDYNPNLDGEIVLKTKKALVGITNTNFYWDDSYSSVTGEKIEEGTELRIKVCL